MPNISFTRKFLLSFSHLPPAVQEKLQKQIELLVEKPRHPSLQTLPIQGAPGIYEAQVDRDYRLTYERDADDSLVLRVVAKPDVTANKP